MKQAQFAGHPQTHPCGRQNNMPPHKDVSPLVLRTCEYITLHGESNTADMIKGNDLEMGKVS